MDSFISWIGGKKYLRKSIIEKFPEHFERYIEVFGGAGWVLFGSDQHAKFEVFNDFNSDLVNLYRCVKYHTEELQKEFDWILNSRETFVNYREQMKIEGLTDIQRAARYFILIRNSFGSSTTSFATEPSNFINKIEYLSTIKERLKRVVIENKDFEDLIKVYDRESALFYLDPPYHGTEKYYKAEFSIDDHYRLCECLKNIKGKFILSYNADEFITELYKDFNIEFVTRKNTLKISRGTRDDFKEVIITNYKAPKLRI